LSTATSQFPDENLWCDEEQAMESTTPKKVTWHSLKSWLTDNPWYFMNCFARQTNKQTNKFVNEENNLYQDLVGSHKATMVQFLHLSQVKNFQPLWFL